MAQRRRVGEYKPVKNPVGSRFQMVASTLQGLESVLAEELSLIGANDIRTGKRAVFFTADKDLVYKANLRLRTALRLLKPIKRFRARDEEMLYHQVKQIDWSALFSESKTIQVRAAVTGPLHTHSHYVSLKVKDAIVDQFREKTGNRPNVDTRDPDIVIHVKIWNDDVNVSLDSSGAPLNQRGYRQKESLAPINECLAAGMLLIAGYDGNTDFVDGMCGSGTICLEAAMIAHKIAPGLTRKGFAFMHWKDYDDTLFKIIRKATMNRLRDGAAKITGYDNDLLSLNLARDAANQAGLDEAVDFKIGDFFRMDAPHSPGLIVMNPPYDERVKVDDIMDLYSKIGDKLKSDYTGYKAWILSGHPDAMTNVGLRTFDTHHLMNGKIECKFSGYKMYSGSLNNKA